MWINLIEIVPFLDMAYFRKRHNNTKWIIQYRQHIKHVQFHCSTGGAHHNQIQMEQKNSKMKQIERKSLYDIRLYATECF